MSANRDRFAARRCTTLAAGEDTDTSTGVDVRNADDGWPLPLLDTPAKKRSLPIFSEACSPPMPSSQPPAVAFFAAFAENSSVCSMGRWRAAVAAAAASSAACLRFDPAVRATPCRARLNPMTPFFNFRLSMVVRTAYCKCDIPTGHTGCRSKETRFCFSS